MITLLVLAQIAIVAHAPDTASACVPFELTVAARSPGAIAPRVELPLPAPWQLLRRSVVSRVERDGAGQPSSITEGTFVVTTNAVGHVSVPGFTATVGATHAESPPAAIAVHSVAQLVPAVLVRARLEREPALESPGTLYVGEQVDYVVDVQLNRAARTRLRRNPTFFPPEMPSMLAYDLPAPRTVGRDGRRCFESLSYRRALFPLYPGNVAIAPAALSYSLPLSTSFFSREESVELHTDSARMFVREPPAVGRPAEYAGAVGGSLSARARVSASSGRMGDPVILTLRVIGTGNVKLWPRPTLRVPWAALALGAERVEVDSLHDVVSGSKEFDWLVTPRESGARQLPVIDYIYFDPRLEVYRTVHADSIGLDVSAAALASADTLPAIRLALRSSLHDERAPFLPARPIFWLLLALAPAPAAVRRARATRRRRRLGLSPAESLRRAALADHPVSARELRRLFQSALGERVPLGRDAGGRSSISRALLRAGVTRETAARAGQLADALDAAAFSSRNTVDSAAAREVHTVLTAIDLEALPARAGTLHTLPLALLVVALGSALLAASPAATLVHAFADGVARYEAADYRGAQRLFESVAARAPRAVDAWANAGAAAWAHGDTASAARDWQRALRIEPTDAETRERLTPLQPESLSARASVAPVSPDALAIATLMLWILGWLVIAIPPARRPLTARAWAGGTIVAGLLTLTATLEAQNRLDSRQLAVLRSGRSLLDSPSPSAQPIGAGSAGEGGTLGARDGAWVRLTLDGARAGWVPVESVLALDAPGD